MPVDPNDPFSESAIAKAVKDVQALPHNQVQAGVVSNATDGTGIEIEGEADFKVGKVTGFAAEDASWLTKTGYKVAGWLGFKWS